MWFYGSKNEASFKFQHLKSVLGFCIILHDALSFSATISRKNISEARSQASYPEPHLAQRFRFEIRHSRYHKLHCKYTLLSYLCSCLLHEMTDDITGRQDLNTATRAVSGECENIQRNDRMRLIGIWSSCCPSLWTKLRLQLSFLHQPTAPS